MMDREGLIAKIEELVGVNSINCTYRYCWYDFQKDGKNYYATLKGPLTEQEGVIIALIEVDPVAHMAYLIQDNPNPLHLIPEIRMARVIGFHGQYMGTEFPVDRDSLCARLCNHANIFKEVQREYERIAHVVMSL